MGFPCFLFCELQAQSLAYDLRIGFWGWSSAAPQQVRCSLFPCFAFSPRSPVTPFPECLWTCDISNHICELAQWTPVSSDSYWVSYSDSLASTTHFPDQMVLFGTWSFWDLNLPFTVWVQPTSYLSSWLWKGRGVAKFHFSNIRLKLTIHQQGGRAQIALLKCRQHIGPSFQRGKKSTLWKEKKARLQNLVIGTSAKWISIAINHFDSYPWHDTWPLWSSSQSPLSHPIMRKSIRPIPVHG